MSTTAKFPPSKKSAQLVLDAQPEPAQPRLLTAEPTIEGLVKSLCHGLPSMGLFSDEGGEFLGGSTMSKDNMIKAITHLSTLWDGSPIDRSRAMTGESLRAYAPRWIIANEQVNAALQLARDASPRPSRNLLACDESYATFLQLTVLPARETLHGHGLKGFHELRAAYACERYEQLTGHAAPVNGGHCYRIDCGLDQQARQLISLELGHNRIDVVSEYIGGRA